MVRFGSPCSMAHHERANADAKAGCKEKLESQAGINGADTVSGRD